ncbi:MAG: GHKL domain-containing protein, partial [Candidatus Thorarchaeota archaeon]
EVIRNYSNDLSILFVDTSQMTRLIINLILNAIHAMQNGGILNIEGTVSEPRWVSLSVSDTGIGMSDETLGKLFDPLFTTKAKGIGLGLVIIETIVKAHGGKVEVESEEGKGSIFTIKIPTITEVEE